MKATIRTALVALVSAALGAGALALFTTRDIRLRRPANLPGRRRRPSPSARCSTGTIR